MASADWNLKASSYARNTVNPIRAIVDNLNIPKNPPKKLIPLSIGDPTVFGNLALPETASSALIKALESKKANGYGPSTGSLDARQAVAEKFGCEVSVLRCVLPSCTCGGCRDLRYRAVCVPVVAWKVHAHTQCSPSPIWTTMSYFT